MNFQQLRIIRETVRRNFNLTEVANHLYTSQSGVSKHIKDLGDELGVELYVRRGKRLLDLHRARPRSRASPSACFWMPTTLKIWPSNTASKTPGS